MSIYSGNKSSIKEAYGQSIKTTKGGLWGYSNNNGGCGGLLIILAVLVLVFFLLFIFI